MPQIWLFLDFIGPNRKTSYQTNFKNLKFEFLFKFNYFWEKNTYKFKTL